MPHIGLLIFFNHSESSEKMMSKNKSVDYQTIIGVSSNFTLNFYNHGRADTFSTFCHSYWFRNS